MSDTMRRTPPPKKAPLEARVGRILAGLRGIAQRMWRLFPDALLLEAELVAIIGDGLLGERTLHHGTRSEDGWEDVFDGKRRILMGDFCRLVKSSRPKATGAVDAVLARLAAERGYTLRPTGPVDLTVAEAFADVARETGDLLGKGGIALADGTCDARDIEILETELQEAEAATVRLRVALHQRRTAIAAERSVSGSRG
jgi:hypothetical protein